VLTDCEIGRGAADATQRSDVLTWIAGGTDATFSRLWRVLGYSGTTQQRESRFELFSRFACMNLVEQPLGPTNRIKANDEQLREAAGTLFARLATLQPRTVWIASKRAVPFAVPVVREFGARIVRTPHPLYAVNVADDELRSAWAQTQEEFELK
jgi:hypothetical protein